MSTLAARMVRESHTLLSTIFLRYVRAGLPMHKLDAGQCTQRAAIGSGPTLRKMRPSMIPGGGKLY